MATNINKAGIDTGTFLPRVIPSSYSSVAGIPMPLEGLSDAQIALLQEPSDEALITGTRGAILPMTITLADKNNDKISFILLINPENVNHGKTNSVYAGMTRKGFITQMWGPNQALLTATGKSAAFYASGIGLTNISRQRTFGFKNFMSLFSTYRNNGYELLDMTQLTSLTRVINVIHGVEIDYDGQILMGHFNNFTLDENAENPYIFNYNFEFVVSSLSDNFNEIRGHFIPSGEKIVRQTKLVSKVGKTLLSVGNEQFTPLLNDEGRDVDIVAAAVTGTQGYGIRPLPQDSDGGAPADIENLEPATKAALLTMAKIYRDTYGEDIPISSGRRTLAQQQKLYDDYISGRSPYPANPPNSNDSHVRGAAFDIALNDNPKILTRLNSVVPPYNKTLLQTAGLIQPLPGTDPVHFRLPLKGERS